ncbi:helix-turn-helix domain-containing protein [Psychrobacter sp. I-STPA6b]|uniref:helix-turn-helix domain-containing protein n=1 Tax=Psychrobacter sp. I-STPA6b TaxID=2585718 RepID=UPI001D0C63C4|nr:helix-turn-helix domain-containing protein [Psychrobacter sp. I-STPA6b]
MTNFPEIGYTPSNYKALVKSTGLTNADFYRTFDIPKQTFYKHLKGSRTMKWQDWQALLKQVENYLKNNSK